MRAKVTPLEAVYGLLVLVQAMSGAPELVVEGSAVAVLAAVVVIWVVSPVVMSTTIVLEGNDVVSMIVSVTVTSEVVVSIILVSMLVVSVLVVSVIILSVIVISVMVVSVMVVSEETMLDAPALEVWELPINSDWVGK